MIRRHILDLWFSQLSQRTIVNRQVVESLGYRVEALVESLCMPASEGDIGEETRRRELEQ